MSSQGESQPSCQPLKRMRSVANSDALREKLVDAKEEAKYTRGNQFSQSYYLIASLGALLAPVAVFLGASALMGAVLSLIIGPVWMMVDGWSGHSDATKHQDGETRMAHFKHMLKNPFKFAHKIFDVVFVGALGLASFVGVIAVSVLSKSFVAAMASVGAWFAPVGFGALALTAFMGAHRAYKASKHRLGDTDQRAKERREAILNLVAGLGALLLCVASIVALATPPGALIAASVIAGLSVAGGIALAASGLAKVRRMYKASKNVKPFVKNVVRRVSSLGDQMGITQRLSFLARLMNGLRSFLGMKPITRRVTRSSSHESSIDAGKHDQEHGGLGAPIPRASTFSGVVSNAHQNTSSRHRAATVAGDLSHAQPESMASHDAGTGVQDDKNAEQLPANRGWQRVAQQVKGQATTPQNDIPVSNAQASAIDQVVQNAGREGVEGEDKEIGLVE